MKVVDDILLISDSEKIETIFLLDKNNIKEVFISHSKYPNVLRTFIDNEMLEVLTNEQTYFDVTNFLYVVINHEIVYLADLNINLFIHSKDVLLTDSEIAYLESIGYENIEVGWSAILDKRTEKIIGDVFSCKNIETLLIKLKTNIEGLL